MDANQPNLKIKQMRVEELTPYIGNAKKHPEWQVEQIKNSIVAFGFNDPIAVWEDIAGHLIIVEGHGRLLAAKELGMEQVPVIRLDHLDDEGRRAYTLAHNKLTMNTDFDSSILDAELDAIEGLDMTEFGFEEPTLSLFGTDGKYTDAVETPVYEVKGEVPSLGELIDTSKMDELCAEIDKAELEEEIKSFLRLAATRHIVFNYSKIAEYYAQADKAIQELMENSALVIIDVNDAIRGGYMQLVKGVKELFGDD